MVAEARTTPVACGRAPALVPVLLDGPACASTALLLPASVCHQSSLATGIDMELSGAVMRIGTKGSAARITPIIRALKASLRAPGRPARPKGKVMIEARAKVASARPLSIFGTIPAGGMPACHDSGPARMLALAPRSPQTPVFRDQSTNRDQFQKWSRRRKPNQNNRLGDSATIATNFARWRAYECFSQNRAVFSLMITRTHKIGR